METRAILTADEYRRLASLKQSKSPHNFEELTFWEIPAYARKRAGIDTLEQFREAVKQDRLYY